VTGAGIEHLHHKIASDVRAVVHRDAALKPAASSNSRAP
jgi:hypothetical protein